MAQFTLTNHGLMALGLYIGFKAAYRRQEADAFGVDYDKAYEEFRRVGLMRGKRMDLDLARKVFGERFPGALGSQTHMYASQLGFKRKMAFGN